MKLKLLVRTKKERPISKNKFKKQRIELKLIKHQISLCETKYEDIKVVSGDCGLKKEPIKNQYRKKRDRNTYDYKRKKEADKNNRYCY